MDVAALSPVKASWCFPTCGTLQSAGKLEARLEAGESSSHAAFQMFNALIHVPISALRISCRLHPEGVEMFRLSSILTREEQCQWPVGFTETIFKALQIDQTIRCKKTEKLVLKVH
jgi:hypothetical protein